MKKKSFIPRIACRDIVVYKLVDRTLSNSTRKFITPYRKQLVELGETYKGIFKDTTFTDSLFSRYIYSGYIHSYAKKGDLRSNAWYAVIKCIIPRGTLYFIGTGGEIASRKLKYVEVE